MTWAIVAARWAMISFVGAALVLFMVFDVLDLDGSNLRRPATGGAMTADATGSEAERLLFCTPESSAAPGGEVAAPFLALSAPAGVITPGTRLPALRLHRIVPHLSARKDALRGTPSSPGDPA